MVLWAFVAQAQDFAQHFVSSCNDDTTISCITISPKMFEEIRIRQGLVKDESMREAINDIKSVRIVEARRHCKKHFNKASSQLSRNSNRFDGSYARIFSKMQAVQAELETNDPAHREQAFAVKLAEEAQNRSSIGPVVTVFWNVVALYAPLFLIGLALILISFLCFTLN